MKLIQISYHFEFADAVEAILDELEVADFVRHARVESRDRDGKHYGTKVFPGSGSLVQALVADDTVDRLLEALKDFREAEDSHRHLTAVVVEVEKVLS